MTDSTMLFEEVLSYFDITWWIPTFCVLAGLKSVSYFHGLRASFGAIHCCKFSEFLASLGFGLCSFYLAFSVPFWGLCFILFLWFAPYFL